MRATIGIVNVVGKRIDGVSIVGVGILQRNLDRHIIRNPVHIKRMFVEHGTVFVEVAHVRADATFEIKIEFVIITLVDKPEA